MSGMFGLQGFLDEARALLPAAVTLRRRIHAKPELGLDLPLTTAAVLDELRGLDVGIARGSSTSGLIVTLNGARAGAQAGRTILLRGDMDALPMPEDTGLDYASEFPGRMHACGHDSHTAMLVQAVHLLHRHRDELAGTVKFMFQPGEEGHGGARLMIKDGPARCGPETRCRLRVAHLAQLQDRCHPGQARSDAGVRRYLDHHREGAWRARLDAPRRN
jgi:metal-dependent amidase/aminoacylase/carboxypeptidase family protein